ncbi:hypothetical protein HYALB_00012806 [Hymenoscyphus albidus]|uniref:2EXR domain-containing protein n=1 Tax=Hymenoscyphus albidus TaxID=595503 RepID=A0A9N9M166_9HELO|nr:hypothetical protein HYALB_00012806 [Hymenoscyphus albidus]
MASLNETAEPVFHLFKKLPPELQQEVWHHAMGEIGERVVEFHGGFYQNIEGVAIEVPGDKQQQWPTYKEAFLAFTDPTAAFEKERENEGGAIWTPRFTSSCATPPFLHTTHGSRKCALRRWKLSFAHGCHPGKVYFDFDKDILIVGSRLEVARAFISEIDTNSLQKLQHIAIKPDRRFQLDYAQFEPPAWSVFLSPVSVPGYDSTKNCMKTIRDKLPSISCVRLINEKLDLEGDECDVRPYA